MESEDGQFSQRCHFLITYTSIRVRQDARFDKSANIHQHFWCNHYRLQCGRIFISMVMVLQRKVVKKSVKNCWNSTLFQSGSHCLAKSAAIPRCTFAPFPKRRSLLLPPRSSLYRQLRSHLGILLFLCALTITAPIRANSEGINCARNSGPFNYSTIRGGSIFICLKCRGQCLCICLCLILCICFELPNNQNWLELLL